MFEEGNNSNKNGNGVEELFGHPEWVDNEVLIAHVDMEEAKFGNGR